MGVICLIKFTNFNMKEDIKFSGFQSCPDSCGHKGYRHASCAWALYTDDQILNASEADGLVVGSGQISVPISRGEMLEAQFWLDDMGINRII